MNTEMTIGELRVLWIVGAAERLATLGILSGDIPVRLTLDAVDTYIEIDDKRQFLFESDYQLAEYFTELANHLSEDEISSEDMNCMIGLLLEYKNNRTELVRHALSLQSV